MIISGPVAEALDGRCFLGSISTNPFSCSPSLDLWDDFLAVFDFLLERSRSERSEESESLCLVLASIMGDGIGEMD